MKEQPIKGEFSLDLTDYYQTTTAPTSNEQQTPPDFTQRLNELNSDLNARRLKLQIQLQQSEQELTNLTQLKQSYVQFFRGLKEMVRLDPSLVGQQKAAPADNKVVRRVFAMAPKQSFHDPTFDC